MSMREQRRRATHRWLRGVHTGVLVALIQVFSVAGCTDGKDADHEVVEDARIPIDSERAIAIARRHLETLSGHPLGKTEAETVRYGSRWSVTISTLPATAGGFAVVRIKEDGTVLDVHGGE